MKKLFKLKRWLTLPDAARYLSGVLEEDVSEADVLQLALDEYLDVSVHFINPVLVREMKVVPAASAARYLPRMAPPPPGHDRPIFVEAFQGIRLEGDKYLEHDPYAVPIHVTGVWDLVLFTNGELSVQQRLQELIGGPHVAGRDPTEGIYLVYPDQDRRDEAEAPDSASDDDLGPVYQLLNPGPSSGLPRMSQNFGISALAASDDVEIKLTRGPSFARTLPDDCTLVVRTDALRDFLHHHADTGTGLSAAQSHPHVSEKLSRMIQASERFWANADPNDRGTHPENVVVAAWLEERGFSMTLADKAATILRPAWAPTGRKPEQE